MKEISMRLHTRFVFVFAILLAASGASAQDPAAPPAAITAASTFEVASIRPSNPDPNNPLSQVPLVRPQPGGRVMVNNFPLRMLIAAAYEMQDFRISGGPPDLMSARFDIVAKATSNGVLSQKEIAPLVKNLLIERFKLKAHTEQREMQIYDLVIARSDGRLGPDIRPSKSDCSKADELNAARLEAMTRGDLSGIMVTKPGEAPTCTIAPNVSGGPLNISVHGDGQEIKQLIELLTPMTGRYIRDKTGLTGRYDFDMKLDLQALLAMAQAMGMNVPTPPNLPQSDGASLMTALNEQLGLKLESVRAPVDVLVIDSVEAPAQD
jgi:uncharacterized protein (TIGR03435 family)